MNKSIKETNIPQIRQKQILDSLSFDETISLETLADQLGVSVSTVRRDVGKMATDNGIEVLRGGFVRLQKRRVDPLASMNHGNNAKKKDIIAQRAVSVVEDGDIIFIDSGTTTSLMGKYLNGKRATVVTTSISFLSYLPIEGVNCIIVGGEVVSEREAVCGVNAEKHLSQMYFDKAFISISGCNDDGVYANDIREARNKELVKERSHCTYLLADTSKLNRWGFLKFMDMNEGILITEDNELPNNQNDESIEPK